MAKELPKGATSDKEKKKIFIDESKAKGDELKQPDEITFWNINTSSKYDRQGHFPQL